MSLRDLDIQQEYRSLIHNVAKDFYIPTLGQAVLYQRAVGFFSSTALIEISKGITQLIQNGGKIQLIASPKLSDEDINAIEKGYEKRDIIEKSLLRELVEHENKFEKERLNLLVDLIAKGHLDIKIAVTETNHGIGMYHEKVGIITDANDDKIAFSGSMNETFTAMTLNYESIDVFCSWKDVDNRVASKVQAFHSIWNNTEPGVISIEFPNVKTALIEKYKHKNPNYDIDKMEYLDETIERKEKVFFSKPENVLFYEYQKDAIKAWKENGYCGIFDMATGTGKTYTGLGALATLSVDIPNGLGVFIVCPYQHLVEQWVEDITFFGVTPLICYSAHQYKSKLKHLISDFNLGIVSNFCVITTNSTFAMPHMQNLVDQLKGDICLLVDEAHNFGAKRQLACMKDVFRYRLALSATLNRHHDEEGTNRLKEYFGQVCIEYTLERAILENKLTPYKYYPIPIYLEEDELAEYASLTAKIQKLLRFSKNKEEPSKNVEMLLIQRARIIAGARNKLPELHKIIKEKYVDKNNLLIYCGATTVRDDSAISSTSDEEDSRQINIVLDILGNQLDMKVAKFTSDENAKEREKIKSRFAKGNMLQALVAIRCLDEGVNIPGIQTAFILASSTNPKEYIQRRGRVLRKAKGKTIAEIYDFITLPRDLNDCIQEGERLSGELSLVKREFERMKDFAKLSLNSSEVVMLEDEITEFYKLNYIGGMEDGVERYE